MIDVCMKISDDCYRGEQDAREIANTAATAILRLRLRTNEARCSTSRRLFSKALCHHQ